jgi:two-component system, sensor histidine kinase and response regulator
MKTILLIDDEAQIRDSLAEILELNGYQVITAENGKDGLLKAILNNPDLIILDMMMPEMDGLTFIKLIRQNPVFDFTPVIFATAKAKIDDMREGLDFGAEDYITKPFSSDTLIKAIENKLEKFRKIKKSAKISSGLSVHDVYFKMLHEVGTALNGILGGVDILEQFSDNLNKEERERTLKNIRLSASRLQRIFDNNRWFEKIRKGLISPEPEALFSSNIEFIIQKIIKELKKNYDYKQLDLQITIEPVNIGLEERRLTKILYEILDNACKFSKGKTNVRVSGKVLNNIYYLSISDSGSGFDVENYNSQREFRQLNRDVFEQQGMGLGLHIAISIMESLNITYSIESSENGTKITCQFPVAV